MRRHGLLGACAALTLLAGCGGGDPEPAAPAPPAAPAASAPAQGASGSTGASAATGPSASTGAAESAPTAPLPTAEEAGGATVVQGTYVMRVTQVEDVPDAGRGDELSWGAVTSCEDECEVELRRENPNGGFKTVTLESDGASRYAVSGRGESDRCPGSTPAPTRDRTSLSVKKVRDADGVQLATEIEGFVRTTYNCNGGGVTYKQVLRLRGRLQG